MKPFKVKNVYQTAAHYVQSFVSEGYYINFSWEDVIMHMYHPNGNRVELLVNRNELIIRKNGKIICQFCNE